MNEDTTGFYGDPPKDVAHLYRFEKSIGKWVYVPRRGQIGDDDAKINPDSFDKGVYSEEKGSGARHNSGKPPMQYIPLEQQISVLQAYWFEEVHDVFVLLRKLSEFEKRQKDTIAHIIDDLTVEDLHDAADVWEYGARKYSAWNWAKGMAWSIPLACISRHAKSLIVDDEPMDEESGCTHWGHIVCNLLMLDHYSRYYRSGDDRPPAYIFEQG